MQLAQAARAASDNRFLPVGAPESRAERITTQVVETLIRKQGYTDDITILAACRADAPAPLDLRLAVDEGAVATVRIAVQRWLERLGVRQRDVAVVVHAAVELIQNVRDHAYPTGRTGEANLTLRLGDSEALLVVRDGGRWRPGPPTPGRGRGLPLVRSLADDVTIDAGDGGTSVTVRAALGRPADPLLTNAPKPHRGREDFEAWQHRDEDHVVVGAIGPLDATTVAQLASHLALATAQPGADVRLDLTDLTLLSSAGVRLLLEARQQTPTLRIVAPSGSVAQHVLTLVAIPHVTST